MGPGGRLELREDGRDDVGVLWKAGVIVDGVGADASPELVVELEDQQFAEQSGPGRPRDFVQVKCQLRRLARAPLRLEPVAGCVNLDQGGQRQAAFTGVWGAHPGLSSSHKARISWSLRSTVRAETPRSVAISSEVLPSNLHSAISFRVGLVSRSKRRS